MSENYEIPPAPERPADAHKGTFGTVIVVGGSTTMIGAPALCATAAFRGGAGLVKLATPAKVLPFALTIEPGATGVEWPKDLAKFQDALKEVDKDSRAVLAVGPGMGKSSAAEKVLNRLLQDSRTMVLDADGLNLLAETGRPRRLDGGAGQLVLTPHPGEFARLASAVGIPESGVDEQTRPLAARKLAVAHCAVVVLKGHRTVVADQMRTYVNATGNAALATAGSGDILTGLIAALIAQRMSPFDAAVLGVYLHGLAADLWAAEFGPSGMTARDLAARIPTAFEHHRHGNVI